jgi:2-polyprenyl-6-methoxyphenol hydroxylase-like FAD-dependent oxidoreductase
MRGRRAVVIGSSVSGLLAARVLADHCESVTVVDRDVLPAGPLHRRGVPQAAHGHVLLARCPPILAELFPGFLHELVADGVPVWADGDLSKIDLSFGGHRLVRTGRLRYPEEYVQYYPSRPLLEYLLRQRIQAIPNVTILDRCDAVGLEATADRAGVVGVRVADREHGGSADGLRQSDVENPKRGAQRRVRWAPPRAKPAGRFCSGGK